VPHLDVQLAMRPGTGDATTILLMRCLRTVSYVLFASGALVAWLADRLDDLAVDDLQSPAGLARSLTTPLAVIAVAVAMRVLVTFLAFAFAAACIAVTHADFISATERTRVRRLVDHWRLAGAFRSLRWTWTARDLAITRLGGRGLLLARADTWLRIAAIAIALLLLVLMFNAQL
jgi:hypothetical protein